MAEKLELEDYKVITYQNDESFDFELSLLLKVKEKLPMIRNLDFPLGLMKILKVIKDTMHLLIVLIVGQLQIKFAFN